MLLFAYGAAPKIEEERAGVGREQEAEADEARDDKREGGKTWGDGNCVATTGADKLWAELISGDAQPMDASSGGAELADDALPDSSRVAEPSAVDVSRLRSSSCASFISATLIMSPTNDVTLILLKISPCLYL